MSIFSSLSALLTTLCGSGEGQIFLEKQDNFILVFCFILFSMLTDMIRLNWNINRQGCINITFTLKYVFWKISEDHRISVTETVWKIWMKWKNLFAIIGYHLKRQYSLFSSNVCQYLGTEVVQQWHTCIDILKEGVKYLRVVQ